MTLVTPLALALALGQAPAPAPSTPAPTSPPPPAVTAPAQPEAPAQPPSAAAAVPTPTGPTLTLDDALVEARQRNFDLKALDARLKQSNELSWKAWSGYLPQLTLSGTVTRNEFFSSLQFPTAWTVRQRDPAQPPGSAGNPTEPSGLPGNPTQFFAVPSASINATLQERTQLAGQAQLTQLLVAPQLWFAIQAAGRGETVAALSIDNGRREILFGVARAYYGVASLKQAVSVSERLLEIAQRQEKDARVRYQAGAAPKVALIRAEIDRARAEQDLKRARNAYLSAREALAVLLARDVAFEVTDPPEPPLPADLSTLEDQALRERPDVLAARAQVGVEQASRNGAMARYLPNVGAFANWTITNAGGFTGQDHFYAIGLQAQWKVFDGGLRESDIREGNARIAEAEANAASTELRSRLEVRQALLDLDSARANAAKAKEQRDLAAENSRLVDVAYRAGTATAVEQADATAALRNAEIALLTENLNAQLSAVQLLKVAGVFEPGKRR